MKLWEACVLALAVGLMAALALGYSARQGRCGADLELPGGRCVPSDYRPVFVGGRPLLGSQR